MLDELWVEKYRPQKVSDCVLPTNLKKVFEKVVKDGNLQNMLFTGSAGVGKTTVAKAICRELNLDWIIINGSEDGNIDTLRTKIRQFASTVSLYGGVKVVILDEADYLNPQSTQPALRGFIEEFSDNCRFILTCNYKNRVIEPLHSRCSVYEFGIQKKDLPSLSAQFMKRLEFILKSESVEYKPKVVAELIMRYATDWRRIINECQRYAVNGKIDNDIFKNLTVKSFDELMQSLKAKDFKAMRKWVVDNLDLETTAIFRNVYDSMGTHLQPQSIPQVILILADYQMKDAFVADHEINIVACMTEIMQHAKWQ